MSERLSELRSALNDVLAKNDEIAKSFKLEDKADSPDSPGTVGVVVTSEQRDEFRKNLDSAKEIKGLISDLEAQAEMHGFSTSSDGSPSVAVAAAAGAAGDERRMRAEAKTIGQAFTESEEFGRLRQSGGATMQSPWSYKGDLGSGRYDDMEQKDVYTALPGTMTTLGFGRMQIDPIVPQQFRSVRVRDLFPVVSTDANLIDYFRVTGFNNAASVVPERDRDNVFGLKPQSTLEFEVGQAPVRTIAHWEAAHRNVLADEPQLQGIINNELLYGLRLQEDYQILSGAGTSEDLLGILNTPNVQTYAKQASPENNADAVRKAVTKIMLAYYEPTGVVFHPNNWEATELLKDNDDRYLVAGSVAIGAQKTLWRMPVVDTPAIPEGTGLVGAFGLGAQLYDRETGNIRVAEQHQDFFLRNAIVILAEERLALAVKRPESFCTVTSLA